MRTPACAQCQRSFAENQTTLLCTACLKRLGFRAAAPLLQERCLSLHSATLFNAEMKRVLYGYKFYQRNGAQEILTSLLTEYWRPLNAARSHALHPESIAVVGVPPHSPERIHTASLARVFARAFQYDLRPQLLSWQRPVERQHEIADKAERLRNIHHSLQAIPDVVKTYSLIIIVDDLSTSGATLREASRAIHAADPGRPSDSVVALAVSKMGLHDSGQR